MGQLASFNAYSFYYYFPFIYPLFLMPPLDVSLFISWKLILQSVKNLPMFPSWRSITASYPSHVSSSPSSVRWRKDCCG
ncbi:hypothetical protein BJX76DRAFT_331668 [Aspergillus varians]